MNTATAQRLWFLLLLTNVFEDPVRGLSQEVPSLLVRLGINTPAELLRWPGGKRTRQDIQKLLGCTPAQAAEIHSRCNHYDFVYSQSEALSLGLGNLYVSTVSSSASQTDSSEDQPVAVKRWDDFISEYQEFENSHWDTPPVFPGPTRIDTTKRESGEASYEDAAFVPLSTELNRILRYVHHVAKACSNLYKWLKQVKGTIHDSQKKNVPRHKAKAMAKEQAEKPQQVKDMALCVTVNNQRFIIAIGEFKSGERLKLIADANTPGAIEIVGYDCPEDTTWIAPPDLVSIWNSKISKNGVLKGLRNNVRGAVGQLTRYCRTEDAAYGFISNYWFWWFIHFSTDGCAYISDAYTYECTGPSIRQLLHFITWKSIEVFESKFSGQTSASDGGLPGTDNSSGRGPDNDTASPSPDAPPGPASSKPGRKGKTSKTSKLKSKISKTTGRKTGSGKRYSQAPSSADVLRSSDQLPPSTIAAAADTFNIERDVIGVLGCGWTGHVFSAKLAGAVGVCATKIAQLLSPQGKSIQHEAQVYIKLQPLWGIFVPAVLANGPCNNGRSYMLATQCIAGRHFSPASDQHLLPQVYEALQHVHALGVAHQDLRPGNVLVEEMAEGTQRVWLLDFGHAEMDADEASKLQDLHDVNRLSSRKS